ncbi:hypothetical protein [uncultured Paludibaculum sp.]|uniref:hypothetical protein n=1 Tax=uncultured Paludibaculum sp. TaxID=1765020 RepID=UPI002AAC26F6|nr:hypothetical protein [uncultured Paludibaculum sp.]
MDLAQRKPLQEALKLEERYWRRHRTLAAELRLAANRAIAETRAQNPADPSIRTFSFEWHMLQGHLALYESRERALFNAGLEYGRGNEDAAREWVLRQHGYIQALNRYAGWIQMRLRRVETAVLATPAGLDHLAQLLASCE